MLLGDDALTVNFRNTYQTDIQTTFLYGIDQQTNHDSLKSPVSTKRIRTEFDKTIDLFFEGTRSNLLKTNQRVAVASHLHPLWFKLLGSALPVRSFSNDNNMPKLLAYHNHKESPYSEKSLGISCKLYGASYIDLQYILLRLAGKASTILLD